MFPSITEYNRVIQNRGSDAFAHETDLVFIPSRTLPIKIFTFGSGAYAVVFKASQRHRTFAFRCYLSAADDSITRSKIIYDYLQSLHLNWKVDCKFLDNEIWVNDQGFPVVKMEWIEGLLINQFVSKYLNSPLVLSKLQSQLVAISRSLEANHIGHGDIQSGNVIIEGSEHDFQVKLIDYDGIYIPALANKKNLEKGRSEFQHPGRNDGFYNERIDRFSFWVIITALEALKFDKSLWIEEMQGGYNTLDNFLFKGTDFQSFNHSNLVNRLYGLNRPSLSFYLNKLSIFCNSTIENVSAPELFDSGENEYAAPDVLPPFNDNGDLIEITSDPSGAIVLSSTFHRLGVTPFTLPKNEFTGKTIILSYKNESQRVLIDLGSNEFHVKFDESLESDLFSVKPPLYLPVETHTPHVDNPIVNTKVDNEVHELKGEDWVWLKTAAVMLAVIIIAAMLIALGKHYESQNAENKTNFSTYGSVDTTVTDTSTIQDINNWAGQQTTDVDTAVYDRTVRDTTVNTVAINTSDKSYINVKDSYQETSTETVLGFFNALNTGDYTAAWARTFNPTWEAKGIDWFISAEGYGSVTKVINYKIKETSSGDGYSEIYAFYYEEGANETHMCFTQAFTVKMFTVGGRLQWLIAGVKNLEAPYPCELPS